jgi:hypothetical protein
LSYPEKAKLKVCLTTKVEEVVETSMGCLVMRWNNPYPGRHKTIIRTFLKKWNFSKATIRDRQTGMERTGLPTILLDKINLV